MTKDAARKRATRDRVGGTRDRRTSDTSYAAAVRTDPKQRARDVDDVAAATVSAPVALMLARHMHAAGRHVGAFGRLLQEHRVAPKLTRRRLGEEPDGPTAPLETAHGDMISLAMHLRSWAERTAHASGVTPVESPSLMFGDGDTAARDEALRLLYPVTSNDRYAEQWCAAPGGHMPQPGETHSDTGRGPRAVRYSLPDPVTQVHLIAHGEGRDARRAEHVVPGTPAASIWDAHDALYDYGCGWMDRRGDSPADLAAAVDGLVELADAFATAASQVTGEIQRRVKAGTLTGVDQAKLGKASAELAAILDAPNDDEDWGNVNHLRGPFYRLRQALVGAKAALGPKPLHSNVFGRKYAGKTPVQLRDELGKERFTNRQIEKTTLANHRKADVLESMLAWMHATGAQTYDPARHLADVQAAQQ